MMGRKERKQYKTEYIRMLRRINKEYNDLPSHYSQMPGYYASTFSGEWKELEKPIHDGYDLIADVSYLCPRKLKEELKVYLDYIYNDRPIHSSGKDFRYCDTKGNLLWRYKGYADSQLSYYYDEDKTLSFEKVKSYIFLKNFYTKEKITDPILSKWLSLTEERKSLHGETIGYTYSSPAVPASWISLKVIPHYRHYEWWPNGEGHSKSAHINNKYCETGEFSKYVWNEHHTYRWKDHYSRSKNKRELKKILDTYEE